MWAVGQVGHTAGQNGQRLWPSCPKTCAESFAKRARISTLYRSSNTPSIFITFNGTVRGSLHRSPMHLLLWCRKIKTTAFCTHYKIIVCCSVSFSCICWTDKLHLFLVVFHYTFFVQTSVELASLMKWQLICVFHRFLFFYAQLPCALLNLSAFFHKLCMAKESFFFMSPLRRHIFVCFMAKSAFWGFFRP